VKLVSDNITYTKLVKS